MNSCRKDAAANGSFSLSLRLTFYMTIEGVTLTVKTEK